MNVHMNEIASKQAEHRMNRLVCSAEKPINTNYWGEKVGEISFVSSFSGKDKKMTFWINTFQIFRPFKLSGQYIFINEFHFINCNFLHF